MFKAPVKWELVATSNCGFKNENQDNYLMIYDDGLAEYMEDEAIVKEMTKDWKMGCVRLVVADGVGGHKNGRAASEALITALKHLPFQSEAETLRANLLKLHNNLHKKFGKGEKTPGSTLVIADIDSEGNATIGSIGDSRAYRLKVNKSIALTRDQTIAEYAWRDKEINVEEYEKSRQATTNVLAQAMIFGSSGIIPDKKGRKLIRHNAFIRLDYRDVFKVKLELGEGLLLASDGLWAHTENNQFQMPLADIKSLPTAIKKQHEQAIWKGSTDNITSVIARMT